MKKAIVYLLVAISVLVLIIRFGFGPLSSLLGLSGRAGLRVDSTPGSRVTIDNQSAGDTPVQKEDLNPGEHLVSLTSDSGAWSGYVNLNSGTLSVVNRSLAPTEASSSGDIITLGTGQGVTVVSNPSGADVNMDGQGMGVTPVTIHTVSSGEHLFIINHSNYLQRSVKASVVDGFNLLLNVDLAISGDQLVADEPTPVPTPSVVVGVVKQTPTGFLNIRDQASLNGKQVGQVSSGDTVTILQELKGWDNIETSGNVSGYVSSQYIQKKP